MQSGPDELRTALLGAEHIDTLEATSDVALVLIQARRVGGGAQAQRSRSWRRAGESSGQITPSHSQRWTSLGCVLQNLGELDEARKLHEEVLEARRRILGPDHQSHNCVHERPSYRVLEARQTRMRPASSSKSPWRHIGVSMGQIIQTHAVAMHNLGKVFIATRANWAVPGDFYEQALEVQRRILGPDHPDTLHG